MFCVTSFRVSRPLSSIAAAVCLLAVGPAFAEGGINLPYAPQAPGGQDSIQTSSGTSCQQSMNNNGAFLDVGLAGSSMTASDWQGSRDQGYNAGAYARIVIPLGERPKRIDCTRLLELEVQRMRIEIETLRRASAQ